MMLNLKPRKKLRTDARGLGICLDNSNGTISEGDQTQRWVNIDQMHINNAFCQGVGT